MATKRKALGYCRVSTDNQAEAGTIEIQQKAILEYARKQGYELVEIFSDAGISGSKELIDRPALTALYMRLEAKDAEIVIIYKLDRLARDLMISDTSCTKSKILAASYSRLPSQTSKEQTRWQNSYARYSEFLLSSSGT